MTITEIRFAGAPNGEFLAHASIVFDGVFVVRSVAVIVRGDGRGILLAMPQRQREDGVKVDVAHPTSGDFRKKMEREVWREYVKQFGEPKLPSRSAQTNGVGHA